MSDGSFIRIRDREISERWKFATYASALAVAGIVTVVAFVVAIVIIARVVG